jgi:hypothetical protein
MAVRDLLLLGFEFVFVFCFLAFNVAQVFRPEAFAVSVFVAPASRRLL